MTLRIEKSNIEKRKNDSWWMYITVVSVKHFILLLKSRFKFWDNIFLVFLFQQCLLMSSNCSFLRDLFYHYNISYLKVSKLDYNFRQNIWRHFRVLAQFLFPTSETEVDYYHQKVSVRVSWRVAERLKT